MSSASIQIIGKTRKVVGDCIVPESESLHLIIKKLSVKFF
ncbi:hypothetical protein VAA_00668 [Vibrio anguillarum 775]|nr:hypothetical protein VAA_00668 [Vibrio anguillarum 775]ARV26861.1 hypothetical protein A6A12_2931 [Vibrio anguillarum]